MVMVSRANIREQGRRTAELDVLRLQRPLTQAEQAEADNLSMRAYFRTWRAQLKAATAAGEACHG